MISVQSSPTCAAPTADRDSTASVADILTSSGVPLEIRHLGLVAIPGARRAESSAEERWEAEGGHLHR